jgi:hypothetical protein
MNPNSYQFLIKVPKTYHGEKTNSSTIVTGKTGYLNAETETRSMLVTLYNQLKVDEGP